MQIPELTCLPRGKALLIALALWGSDINSVLAQAAPASSAMPIAAPSPVVVAGVVPDEATHQAVLGRLREIYGADRVVDQIGVANVVAPPDWKSYVEKLITPDLQHISHGQIKISGNTIDLSGEVSSDAIMQQLPTQMSAVLNPTYSVRSSLHVTQSSQSVLDAAVANRTIEFEAGNAILTSNGKQVLDGLVPLLQKLQGHHFDVIGHTDSQGSPALNISLSAARARAVKDYLVSKGIPADSMNTSGVGARDPVASNATDAGRARNRRIEFHLSQS